MRVNPILISFTHEYLDAYTGVAAKPRTARTYIGIYVLTGNYRERRYPSIGGTIRDRHLPDIQEVRCAARIGQL